MPDPTDTRPDTAPEPMRKHRRGGFVMLDNSAVNDSRLSFRARGLLVYLLGRPDGWAFASERIARETPTEGRDAIRAGLRELEAAGYVRRTRLRMTGGRIRTVTEVAELPELMPPPETAQPSPVQPTPVQPTPVNPSSKTGQTVVRTEVVRKDGDTGSASRRSPQRQPRACGKPEVSSLAEQQALRAAAREQEERNARGRAAAAAALAARRASATTR